MFEWIEGATESSNHSPSDHPVATETHVHPPAVRASIADTIMASGEKAKAYNLLEAIRILKRIEAERRPASDEERRRLCLFPGFGALALTIFPDPRSGNYKNSNWHAMGTELKKLLTDDEYDSAKRTTFSAFYTSPIVIQSIYDAIARLGVPANATMLEPGCGIGNFIKLAPADANFIGVELDGVSGRIAKAIFPEHDIRIESFKETKLPKGCIDAVVGNVPFASINLDYQGQRLALHDYFLAKSVDALKEGGILAVVTSHFTLDKQNAAMREYLASKADFVGAIRLPSDAFKREGTSVVTDIIFLRKRSPGAEPQHVSAEWRDVGTKKIDGREVTVNRYFLTHPEMVLGNWSIKNTLYGDEGFSLESSGDLKVQLAEAVTHLPVFETLQPTPRSKPEQMPCTVPPLDPHIDEGSFFIGDDRTIYQQRDGVGVPVVYGGRTLASDGTMTGRRLAALIGLRDRARRVLQSQNDDWPAPQRDQVRAELNYAYQRFVSVYGPINLTSISENADGTAIRRMPNLVKFREDPDAMLVMALEEYDDTTDKAERAAIMLKDVVGKTKPVEHVETAAEGLLVALNQSGKVNLSLIAQLYGKDEESIITELGNLIYRDPQTRQWETVDVYLSGDVRAKLKAAQHAGSGYERNVAALEHVQPSDILPGDIDANLGAPWVPVSDIELFAAELFRVENSAVRIAHFEKDATWSVDAGYAAEASVGATSEFGTSRVNGIKLLELALNMKTPTIYDTVHLDGREERIINESETLAAREKQKLIKDRFKAWAFDDPERAERLVRLYNDTYNNLRQRTFEGSHLDFPGLNPDVKLRPHQQNAIWRCMSSGNTLLAHVVGAGKTFTMAAAGMKMKQARLIKKPMYVVPNHLLEQFAREFQQLYPNAKLLIATKEDVSKENRKFLTAKIASGQWDGIIVTHSSFERIGMSRDYQTQFLKKQIDEYDELLRDHSASKSSNRNIMKLIEKQKAAREERLKDLLSKDKKDDGLVFDELGVDHVFVDEAHYFKNLETPTKMDRVGGIQTGGSERAFDLYIKSQFLHEQHTGHGITFATGTPISNTMVELYTMQRFLDPDGLKHRGIEHFDAWAASFGEVVESMEITPDGAGLKPKSRFAKFVNLPELQQMFRRFADVQTAGMLNLPRPQLAGGKPTVIACPMSDEQITLQQKLVERYDRIRSQRIDPRIDNALAITTDGRKLATDARMLSADAEDFPESKINRLVENVADIWQQSMDSRGTQLIFSDFGVHRAGWGYSPYDEIVAKLMSRGIPRSQIATMNDVDTDAKKQALFEKIRNGAVRILVGSTQKMGTGTNVQRRLVALHHLDAPWKPAEVEQRDGRILRQGNQNEEVSIYRYVTKGSFDAYMWQALESKAKFIEQVMTGDNASRSSEDVGSQELSFAEVKAIASGNPAVLTLAQADAELHRLASLRTSHHDEQFIARRQIRDLPGRIAAIQEHIAALKQDESTLSAHAEDELTIGGCHFTQGDAIDALDAKLERIPAYVTQFIKVPMGEFRGLSFGICVHADGQWDAYLGNKSNRRYELSKEHRGHRALMNALTKLANGIKREVNDAEENLNVMQSQLRDYQQRLGQHFAHDSYILTLTDLRDKLKASLTASIPIIENPDVLASPELATQIKLLMYARATDTTIARSETKHTNSAEPITVAIRRTQASETAMDESHQVEVGGDSRTATNFVERLAAALERTKGHATTLAQ